MNLVCAALAGVMGRAACHPLDTLKTVAFTGMAAERGPDLHVAGKRHPHVSLSQSVRMLWRTEGLRGFYRGFGVAVLGSAPGVALYLSSYDFFKEWMEAAGIFGNCTALRYFICGFGAEAVSCIVWVPLDVSKERLQSQPSSLQGRYRGSADALRTIVHKEGFRGLYKGYTSTLASFGPFSATYFVVYEYLSRMLPRLWKRADGVEHPATIALVSGAGANAVASVCTNPLELTKTRLQVQRTVLRHQQHPSTLFGYHYRGLLDGMLSIARDEGFRALWKGTTFRIAYSAPNAAITMCGYDVLKRWAALDSTTSG